MYTIKSRIAVIGVLALGILIPGSMARYRSTTAAPVPEVRKVPKELLEKRLEAAKRVWMEKWQIIVQRGNLPPRDLFGWSERWLKAELALLDKKEDRSKAIMKHVERTRSLERLATAQAESGLGRQSDADAATYERIEAEIRYFQATGKVLPPPRGIKVLRDPPDKPPGEPLPIPQEKTKRKK